MTPGFKKIALELLDQLRQTQANAGCNDFDLKSFIPDVQERRSLMKRFEELNGSPEEFDEEGEYSYVQDFMMTAILIDEIGKI